MHVSSFRKTALALLFAGLCSAPLGAATIGFDDLPPGFDFLAPGYAGLNWDNAVFATPLDLGLVPSGYAAGLVSGTNVAGNAWEGPLSFESALPALSFNLDSLWLTGAWNDALQVSLSGYRSGALIYTAVYTVNANAPTLFTPGWRTVDRVEISSYGGIPNADLALTGLGAGTGFVVDDLTVTPVPEPSTYGLCGAAALGGLALWRRRRAGRA